MTIRSRIAPLNQQGCPRRLLRGIRRNFFRLSPCCGQVSYVLLTRAPVAGGSVATPPLPLDLHVLSLSLAFILSQDQTLRCCILSCFSLYLYKANFRQISVCLVVLLSPNPTSRQFVCPGRISPDLFSLVEFDLENFITVVMTLVLLPFCLL